MMFFLFPESNFERPELDLTLDQLTTLHDRQVSKEAEQGISQEQLENAKTAPSRPEEYTISKPSIWEIMQPVSYNAKVNFLKSFVEPLKLLIHPSVLWGIFSYAVTLSPQVILM